MTISDAINWLDAHPTSASVLFLVLLWLTISLLSLVENPRPGSTLSVVVDGVKKWGVDLPGTAHWLKSILSHVRDARTDQLIAKTGVEPPAYPRIADVVTLPVSRPSEEPVTLDLTRDIPPALQPAVSPPANSNPDPPEAAQ